MHVKVTFNLNTTGVLSVSAEAKSKESKVTTNLRVKTSSTTMSEDELRRICREERKAREIHD